MAKKNKKPIGERIKDSKFGKFVAEKVVPVSGDILSIVGDVTGVQALETVGAWINGQKGKSAEHDALALEFEKLRTQFETEMLHHDLKIYEAEVADRTSARNREMEITRLLGKRDWLMATVVLTGLLLLVGVVCVLVFVEVPHENQRLADMTFGAVMSIGASIFSYYVGSSHGSKTKEDVLHKIINR